jgi:hypothetical protein
LDPTIRLRIATRIHFALLRHYDENVSVSSLLKGDDVAREALWVCEASGHDELVSLAAQLASAAQVERLAANQAQASAASVSITPTHAPVRPAKTLKPAARVTVPQDIAWAQDTSGFGFSHLSDFGDSTLTQQEAKPAHWLNPTGWLRRTATR